jgi:hypothetical protein
MKSANRVFALFFFIVVGLWVLWQPIMWEITGESGFPEDLPWFYAYSMYGFFMVGYPIVLVGLAYEVYRPTMDLRLSRDWKGRLSGIFLITVAIIIVWVDMVWKPYDPEYSILGSTAFKFPRGSGQRYVMPNLLWEFLSSFCMETCSFSLMFGLLFMTKSTPQRSKSYKIILIGAIIFEFFCMLTYFLFFLGIPLGPYTEMTKTELLTSYWFHWDFWSELTILLFSTWLLVKGEETTADI